MSHHHHHDDEEGHHHHGEPRISSPEERELLKPFIDDLHEFLRSALDGIDGPIAEIGAGDGVIAQRLRDDGFDVVAIDANAETAAAATEQGRSVEHCDWLTWDGAGNAPFAALLFTRSLHHIEPLDDAVEQMVRLAPGGLLIADEFGYELVDAAGAQFLMDSWAMTAAAGMRDDEYSAVPDTLAAWQERMTVEHEVTSSERLLEAIGRVAQVEQIIYGNFMAQLAIWRVDPTHPRAAEVRDLLIETEAARSDAGLLAKAGIRLTGRLNG